jgi:DNA-binding transcriptional MocR family regulator
VHLWLRLPEGADETATVNAAHQHGVAVSPGRSYFPAEPSGPYLRLSYAAAAPATLLDAVTRLARAIH